MNRISLGVICGVIFGLADMLMTFLGKHPDLNATLFLQAFSSRFAIGVLATNLDLPVPPVIAGAIAGLLISLPDAFGLHAYAGVLGTGLLFGALAGWARRTFARP